MLFLDIGANLTDAMYSGVYNGSQKHKPDLTHVLERAWSLGLDKIIITGGNIEDSKKALEIAKTDGTTNNLLLKLFNIYPYEVRNVTNNILCIFKQHCFYDF